MTYLLTLNQLQRIKQWHVAHKHEHPLEYQLWDFMLCLWVMFIPPSINEKDNSSSNQGDNSIDPQNCSNQYSTKSKT